MEEDELLLELEKNAKLKKIKKILFTLLLVLISGFILWGAFLCIRDMYTPSTESDITGGKDTSKEEYIYKEELLLLGYTVNDIAIIESKISNVDVKNYLLSEKYNNLISFVSSPYFNISNIKRYESYYSKNSSFSTDNIVIYVEIGLDNEFYSNIKEITNYNDVNALVNKYNKLPSKFEVKDLVDLGDEYASGTQKLRKVAASAVIKMIDDAKKESLSLEVISSYRTESKQNSLFNNSVKKNGKEHALLYSAKPGHSEHQLGLAVDLNTTTEKFTNTKEYTWLKNNAYKYGFIERYPKGKEFITGYGYEPWHYRYLGIDIATKIYIENITYEEYLIKYSK